MDVYRRVNHERKTFKLNPFCWDFFQKPDSHLTGEETFCFIDPEDLSPCQRILVPDPVLRCLLSLFRHFNCLLVYA
jgi:hypothetical protein